MDRETANRHKTHDFQIPTGDGDATITLRITDTEVIAQNLPLTTWASSLVLARAMHKLNLSQFLTKSAGQDTMPMPIPILELGAGTGLVGIAAAALTGAASGFLTDLPALEPSIAANICLNADMLTARGAGLRAGTLDWREPATLCSGGGTYRERSCRRALLLLTADTLYDDEHPGALHDCVAAWMARVPEARFILCYPLRVAHLDIIRDMWRRLEDGGLVCESEAKVQGERTNGDDEMLCEYAVWKWSKERLEGQGS